MENGVKSSGRSRSAEMDSSLGDQNPDRDLVRKAPQQGSPPGVCLRQPPGEFRLFPAVPARALHS